MEINCFIFFLFWGGGIYFLFFIDVCFKYYIFLLYVIISVFSLRIFFYSSVCLFDVFFIDSMSMSIFFLGCDWV